MGDSSQINLNESFKEVNGDHVASDEKHMEVFNEMIAGKDVNIDMSSESATCIENKSQEELPSTQISVNEDAVNEENASATNDVEAIEDNSTEVDRNTISKTVSEAVYEVDNLMVEVDQITEPVEIESLDPNITPPLLNDDNNDLDYLSEDDQLENLSSDDVVVNVEANPDDAEGIEELQQYDREQLLQQYKELIEERSKIHHFNQQYQNKLAEYFKKKKTDDRGQEMEKNVTDQEQRYLKYMSNLEELQAAEEHLAGSIKAQTEELKDKCQEKLQKVAEATTELMKYKYEIAKSSVNSRSGKAIPSKDLEQYQVIEAKKEQEVIAVRLENIKLKNRLKKREIQLKAKEELAEGLHLIDFEQLKIENQTYNEKIEERNEELLKLRKKITTTVQVLTHLKEKLQFVQGENGEQRASLRDIEATVAQRRDILTRLKQVRDGLRTDNNKLKYKSGLLGNKPLLRDFEFRKEEAEELQSQLKSLKEQHMELNMNLNGIRRKIERAKPIAIAEETSTYNN